MKRILYSIFALAAAFAMPSNLMADENVTDVQYLVVMQNDGTESKFALKDYPEITYEQDTLVVTTSERSIRVELADLSNYSFATVQEPVATGISNVQSPATPAFSYGNAEFTGLKSGATITAFSANGQMITTIKADAAGVAQIDLSALPKGILLLRTPNKTIKIINK